MSGSTITYHGRILDRDVSIVSEQDGMFHTLSDRRDLHRYPEALDWGNRSAGAAQTALALLAHHLGHVMGDFERGEREAFAWHQRFKDEVIGGLPRGRSWKLTGAQIDAHLQRMRGELAEHAERERFEQTVGEAFDGLS